MSWPLASDFSTALQNPAFAFSDRELKQAEIEKDRNNQPKARSGAFANVYKANFPGKKDPVAVRVFTSASPERRERYQAIADHLASRKLECLVDFTYRDDGIRAMNGKRYPLVTMDWVRGEQLFDWVQDRCVSRDQNSLTKASESWIEMIKDLHKAKIAHGDLQHANILVTEKNKLKLVDYDCMCVPALVGRKNLEIGVDPYQHPTRDQETKLSLELDNFSALFIFVALKAVAASPDLWTTYVARPQYDKMLFRREDLDAPKSSKLIQELQRSRDKEVQRLTNSLVELTKASIDTVPRLEELLFSFTSVESLLSQKDFDGALELLVRNKKQVTDAPAALQPRIQNAQQRVQRRQDLEKAVVAGDEHALKRLYEPTLLDDYPKAQPAVVVARLAPTVIPILERLEVTRQSQKWREFVREWTSHQAVLASRKSAETFATLAKTWKERNDAWDSVLRLLSLPTTLNGDLATAFDRLTRAGGHPESAPHRAKIDKALDRERSWIQWNRLPREASASTDTQIVQVWNEKAFGGWDLAERDRPRYQSARQRLEALEQLQRLASQRPDLRLEEQLVGLAGKLPSDYRYSLEERVKKAGLRISAIRQLDTSLQPPVSDLKVAEICRKLDRLQARGYLTTSQNDRASLAERRAKVLAALQPIPVDFGIQDALKWDPVVLAAWKDDLLSDCLDAQPWRNIFQQARNRRTLLLELEDGIKRSDKLRIAEIASRPELKGYPYAPDQGRIVRQAQIEVKGIRELLDALKRENSDKLLAAFDARVLRRHPRAFQAYQAKLLEWIKTAILPAERIGLKLPLARQGLVQEPDAPECYRVCWDWPEPRFSDQCLVAICDHVPGPEEDPKTMRAHLRLPIDRKSFEEGGGSRRFAIREDWRGGYVCVWAIVNVGFQTLHSHPLVLGQLEPIGTGGRLRLGGLFG